MEIQPKLPDHLIAELRARWRTPEGGDALRRLLASLRDKPLEWKQGFNPPRVRSAPAHNPDLFTDLRGIKLCRVFLRGAHLPYVDLSYAVIEKSNLEDICLQGSMLSYAHFLDCNMKRSDLLQVLADHSSFDLCVMNEAVLGDGDFRGSYFRNVQMPKAILDGADITGSKLEDVTMKGAHMNFTKFPKGYKPDSVPRGPRGPGSGPSP